MASEVFDMRKYNKFKKAYESGTNMKKALGPKTTVKEINLFMKLYNKNKKN
jgi:ASC-1-like (ASCH) protein